jgi:hypothetical protein
MFDFPTSRAAPADVIRFRRKPKTSKLEFVTRASDSEWHALSQRRLEFSCNTLSDVLRRRLLKSGSRLSSVLWSKWSSDSFDVRSLEIVAEKDPSRL